MLRHVPRPSTLDKTGYMHADNLPYAGDPHCVGSVSRLKPVGWIRLEIQNYQARRQMSWCSWVKAERRGLKKEVNNLKWEECVLKTTSVL